MIPEIVFGAGFGFLFLFILALGVIELIGKIYGTYNSLSRNDLTSEQRLIYLGIIWFIPLGWLIYLILGKKKTGELFSEVKFL
ncbi:MAG: hypothetical protein H8Z69_01950 [Nanohaloarchaea archaeon]|nr:hypothetical protein [Candidatus Nanohaloarchaea archaeon]